MPHSCAARAGRRVAVGAFAGAGGGGDTIARHQLAQPVAITRIAGRDNAYNNCLVLLGGHRRRLGAAGILRRRAVRRLQNPSTENGRALTENSASSAGNAAASCTSIWPAAVACDARR